jgi:hypothetical protein
MWSYLSSFQKGTKKRAVIICQVDHMSYFFWRDHVWPAKELKKGINFSCPCALQDHKKFKKQVEVQIFNKQHFKIIHNDKDYVYLCQTRFDVVQDSMPGPYHYDHNPTSLQFQCVASIIAHNLVQQAKDHLPQGIIKVLNEFTETRRLPYAAKLGYYDSISCRCRNKKHRFNLVRNLKPNNWNENTYDLTEGFDWLGF